MNGPDKINAVELVRSIRDAHYEQLKDLSTQEKIAFFRAKARTLHAELGKPEKLMDDAAPASARKTHQ